MKKYDIIVIGAGSAGLNIASFMNKTGFKVLLIDKTDKNIGGDCLNFGCVPSKALIHISRLVHNTKETSKFGLKSNGQIDIKKVVKYIREKKDIIRKHENASYFRKIGMDVALGSAKFISKNSVSVNKKIYTAKKIVIATGSKPRELYIQGIEKVKHFTNETIFDIAKLPKKLLIVGGGPIGIEIGQAFGRLGSKVTVLQRSDNFLPKEDPIISKVLLKQLEGEGMEILMNSGPKKFTSSNEVVIRKGNKDIKIKFDAVLIAIGRQLNYKGLDLEKAGIEIEDRKIKVDEYLRTTNKNVLLCGDIAGSYQFTHAAEMHAGIIISNFFSPRKKKLNNDHLSWVTYTSPEIATFGLNEKELKKREIKYEKLTLDFSDDDRSIVDDYTEGKLILYISKNKILGGSMVAMNAGELFQELVLANSSNLDIKNIFNKIYPYPTAARVNKKIIANHFSKKLSPFVKKIMRFLY